MAVMDPTGGLRDISTLGRSSASLFHEDFSEEEVEREEDDGRPAAEPLVSQQKKKKPRRRRTGLPTKRGMRKFIARLDYHQLNYRLRLTLRITSMITSGTTLGSIGSLLYTYTSTRGTTLGNGDDVWPRNIFFDGTYVMLAAAVATFAADLAFFALSIRADVRKLSSAAHKFSALSITSVCLALVIAAVALDNRIAKGSKTTLFWVCVARQQTWDNVSIDFPFLCGEMVSNPRPPIPNDSRMLTLMVDSSRRDGRWWERCSCRL